MKYSLTICTHCKQIFSRSNRQINEATKFGWKQFCSKNCQSSFKNKQFQLLCENPLCNKKFKRRVFKNSQFAYCSLSCAAHVNNAKFIKRHAVVKNCLICKRQFTSNKKYCSVICKNKGQTLTKESIVKAIKSFYNKTGRIPLKREFNSSAARSRFANWNNAIKAAGLEPNQVLFAKKHIAKDGHKCDSLAERIVDDWLYKKDIKHERSISYPSNNKLTADFLVEGYFIEFFGLHGKHKRYDQLMNNKLKIARENNLKLIGIYPQDLFPTNKLDEILKSFKRIK